MLTLLVSFVSFVRYEKINNLFVCLLTVRVTDCFMKFLDGFNKTFHLCVIKAKSK